MRMRLFSLKLITLRVYLRKRYILRKQVSLRVYFIKKISKVINLSLYIELKNLILLRFYYNYLEKFSSRLSIFKKSYSFN